MTINKSVNFNVLTGENFSRGQKVRVSDEFHPLFSREGRINNISPNQTICVEFASDSGSGGRFWFYPSQLMVNVQNPPNKDARGID